MVVKTDGKFEFSCLYLVKTFLRYNKQFKTSKLYLICCQSQIDFSFKIENQSPPHIHGDNQISDLDSPSRFQITQGTTASCSLSSSGAVSSQYFYYYGNKASKLYFNCQLFVPSPTLVRLLCVLLCSLKSLFVLTELTEQGGTLLCHLTPGYLLIATKDFTVNHSINFYPSLLDVYTDPIY